MINIKDILTLDDGNKYVVASKATYNDNMYYLIIDTNNSSNIKFCYIDNDELVESANRITNTEILPLFYENVRNVLNDLS